MVSKSGNILRKVNSFGPRSHFFPSPITSFFHPILPPKLDRFVLPSHALLWRRIKIQIRGSSPPESVSLFEYLIEYFIRII